MTNAITKVERRRGRMKTYIFSVALERDAEGWRAFFPPLEERGASTWGKTKKEALKNIQEVLSMMMEEFVREGRTIPATEDVTVSEGASIAVHV